MNSLYIINICSNTDSKNIEDFDDRFLPCVAKTCDELIENEFGSSDSSDHTFSSVDSKDRNDTDYSGPSIDPDYVDIENIQTFTL